MDLIEIVLLLAGLGLGYFLGYKIGHKRGAEDEWFRQKWEGLVGSLKRPEKCRRSNSR